MEELITNREKFDIFLEVAGKINRKLKIVPVLYGSLGLNLEIGEFCKSSDVDILIDDKFIEGRWTELQGLMNQLNFRLKNEREHEFMRDEEIVAFAKEGDLQKLADIDSESLEIKDVKGVKFRVLNLNQYLRVYELMDRDDYRKEKRGKEDKEKIRVIKKFLKAKESIA